MESKISSDRILINETIYEGASEQAVDTDFTLPDFCPDIGKIFRCDAAARVTTKSVSNGTLKLEGTTRLTVFYLDSTDKKLACCSKDIPFAKEISVGECPDGVKASVRMRTDYMNCRAVSQRKVDIHGAVTAVIKIASAKSSEIISDAQGGGVKLRQMIRQVSMPVGNAMSQLSISEALELSDGKPPIASILNTSAAFCVSDVRPIANKVIVKGDLLLKVLYRADTDSGAESMEYTIPFNQFFDVTGADDSCVCDFFVGSGYADIGLRTDSDGEYRRMQADVKADCEIKVYRQNEISVITDAYSTQCELQLERKLMEMKKLCANINDRFISRDSIDMDTSELGSVKDVTCTAEIPKVSFGSDTADIEIPINAYVLIEDKDGCYDLKELSFTAHNELKLPNGCKNPSANAYVQVRSVSFSLTSGRIDVSTELEINAAVYDNIDVACVSSITPDDTKPKRADSTPAIVLYFADAGEDLWSIARDHNTSVEKIREENELDEDTITEPKLLLVTV